MSAEQHLHGVVRDKADGLTVSGVVVHVLGAQEGSISDHHGAFHLHIDTQVSGTDSVCLEVRRIGYFTDTVCVGLAADAVVLLERNDVQAHQVDVVGAKVLKGVGTRAVQSVSQEQMDEHRGQTIADALGLLPGVTALRTGASVAKPVVHGVTGQRVMTNVNGVSLEGQQWGEDHGPEIDPFSPVQLSVVKGPASVRFGPGAMGGVIHVEQPPLRWDSIAGAASTNLFLNNVQGALAAWADVPEPFGLPIAIRGEGSVRRAGDMRAPGYALDNTGFSQISGAATVQYGKVPSEPSLKATVSLFNSTIGIFTAAHTGNADDLQRAIASDAPLVAAGDRYSIESPRQEVNHVTLVADGTLPFQSAGELTLRYGYQQNFRNEYDLHNTRIVGQGTDSAERAADSIARLEASLAAPALSLLLSTYNLDAEFAHHPIGPLAGSIGISGLRQANSRGGSVSLIPDYVQWGAAGFINENWLMETIAISAGLRYDARWLDAWPDGVRGDAATLQQRFFGSLSGGLGMRWQSTDELKLSANLGLAWRPPNVNELYSNGVHHGAARYEIGDSTLGSEHMTGLDVNAEVRTSAVSLTASAYANFFDGYIQPLPDPEHPTITVRGTFPTFLYKQTQALIAGVDLDAHVYASEVLELMAQGAVVYGEDRTHEQPLFQMPASRLRVAAHAHGHDVLGLESVYAEVGVLGVATQGRYVPEQDYAPPPPGYVICDLQIGGSLLLGTRHARWSVGCTNLFNTAYRDYLSRYRYYADDAGFDLVLRFTYLLGQQP